MELYYFEPSPPCRAVLMFAHVLNLELQLKETDITKGENLTPEYMKLNPQHTIPLIVDDDFVLSESRAILVYLAEQYGQNYSYYPLDPKARGVINQRLNFDIGTLYPRFIDVYLPLLSPNGKNNLDVSKVNKLKEGLKFLESFIGDSLWMAGDEITIADFSLVATVSSIEACGFDLSQYEKILAWLKRCKTEITDYQKWNQKGADILGNLVKDKLNQTPIDLYYLPGSSPCRAVLLTAKALGIDLNLKITDLKMKEHMTPEFSKMNPQHTIPTINDKGFCLWESRAIMGYLVDMYDKSGRLYPKNPKERALVEQMLYFDAATLYQRFGDLYYPHMFEEAPLDPAKKEKLEQAFQILNTFLEGQTWIAGPNMTIADLSLAATVSTCEAVEFAVKDYPNVAKWYAKIQKEAPGYEVNSQGAETFKQLYLNLTAKK